MKNLLETLARAGEISWLSYYFAEFAAAQSGVEIDDLAALSAALVSESNQSGHVCVELEEYVDRPLFQSARIDADEMPRGIASDRWQRQLEACRAVTADARAAPLRLEGSRLYLHRYWHYEDAVARRLQAMLATHPGAGGQPDPAPQLAADDALDTDQKNAIAIAVTRPFSVISGGPGSGKTSTVVRILSFLLQRDPDCRIALAAPTGKAAARMLASIRDRLDRSLTQAEIDAIERIEAGTIHRLLAYRGGEFGYHAKRRLGYDCVIVDEASMIDMQLMYHLLSAVPDGARLVLLGDRDQLASVAAGNVLGDITGHGSEAEAGQTPIAASVALLRSNYRFDRSSAIGELAQLVNQGQTRPAIGLLAQQRRGLRWYTQAEDHVAAELLDWIIDAYQPIFACDSPAAALDIYAATRVLGATNLGSLGVESLNRLISEALLQIRQLPADDIYHGLPIMITRNDHRLGLYNGDTGILWSRGRVLRACFGDGENGIRDFAINRLPAYAPAWASSVHKSQGSEFERVVLIMPADPESGILSRELLYTAITRARQQFVLHATEEVIASATGKLTRRYSGLAEKLGWVQLSGTAESDPA